MSSSKDKSLEVNVASNQSARRRFLQKTGVVAAITAIPAKPVWASNCMAGSICASGNGSDYAGGDPISLAKPKDWKKNPDHWVTYHKDDKFKNVFGFDAIGDLKKANGSPITNKGWIRLKHILNNQDRLGGPSGINVYLVTMLLNAAAHGQTVAGVMINFPVVKSVISSVGGAERGLFATLEDFADYLYDNAAAMPDQYAMELSQMISMYA